jgi:hypothetical protein
LGQDDRIAERVWSNQTSERLNSGPQRLNASAGRTESGSIPNIQFARQALGEGLLGLARLLLQPLHEFCLALGLHGFQLGQGDLRLFVFAARKTQKGLIGSPRRVI